LLLLVVVVVEEELVVGVVPVVLELELKYL
jgi:hypothetical protein